jgi:ATP-binding cassette subfamily C protein
MGLLKPQSGRVICNDWDIFDHLRTWHANLGYVGQTPFISPRSVRENVAFGYDPDQVDDARVWSALEQAALADVVRGRADGLDAVLGEEGAFLSGGQRQRLSIARALYRDPEVLVFDEATAALDNATERELSQAINSMSGAKTLICIAHRLTTIRHCDIIHYFEDGRIAASGTYAELEANSAGFRKLLHDPAESAHA